MNQKVLYVIPAATFGGAHNQVLQYAESLRQEGIDFGVLLPREEGNAKTILGGNGFEVRDHPLVRIRAVADVKLQLNFVAKLVPQILWLRRYIRDNGYTAVQAHGVTQFDVAIASRLAGRRLIWQLLDTRAPAALVTAMKPLLVSLPHVIMATGTGTLKDHFRKRDPRKPVVIYAPPIRADMTTADSALRARTRKALDVGPDDCLVLSLGNLNPQKGHQYFLEAFSAETLPEVVPLVRGSITAGHEEYVSALRRVVKERQLPGQTVDEVDPDLGVPGYMAAADIFCLASEPRSEGLPTVVLEAMSVGLPVVVSRVGAVEDAVEDGENGYVVDPRDVPGLRRAIHRLSHDERLRERMGQESEAKFRNAFTREISIAANLDAIRIAHQG